MPMFDDIDLERLLEAPEWTDAHECFQEKHEQRKPYEVLCGDGDVPFWLYARTCIEEEVEYRRDRNQQETDSANSAQPSVNRLPRIILARILAHLRDSLMSDDSMSGPSNDRSHIGNPYSWLYVTLVCRHWRNTAYCYPSLWTWINLPYEYDREVLRSLLILSNKESLRVIWDTSAASAVGGASTCSVHEVGELAIMLDLVLDERVRIEVLSMNLSATKFVKIVPWKGFSSRPPWLSLTRLVLRGPNDREVKAKNKQQSRVIPPLSEAIFPQLQELILDGMHPEWNGTCLPALGRLEISNIDSAIGRSGNAARCLVYGVAVCSEPYFDQFLEQCTELRLLRVGDTNSMHYGTDLAKS